jgi:soluble P-type ATPase
MVTDLVEAPDRVVVVVGTVVVDVVAVVLVDVADIVLVVVDDEAAVEEDVGASDVVVTPRVVTVPPAEVVLVEPGEDSSESSNP